MSDTDFENLSEHVLRHGVDSVSPPVVARIDGKTFIVDGHCRIEAAKSANLSVISCHVTPHVKSFQDLRILSYRLNRGGYSNPLLLSDMFFEDLKITKSYEKTAEMYGVNKDYVESLLRIRDLHDDSKTVIQKIINTAKRKYQFLLSQLTPAHLSGLAGLTKEKQLEVIDWIFRDIMYGPPDESMVSIPSVFEILDEIETVTQLKERKTYDKRPLDPQKKAKQIEFTCTCGAKYDVDTKAKTVYEYLERNSVILKKEFTTHNRQAKIFSSEQYTKSELKSLIDESANCRIKIILEEVQS